MRAEALPRLTQWPHPKGTLAAWGRLERLLDEGSFIEFDLFRPHEASARTDGVVTGAGTVYGRSVFVYAQDFRILGGSLPAAHAAKIQKVMDLALAAGAPLIALNDSDDDIVPASPGQPYDMRTVLTEITDHGEFLELQSGWGRTIVCALARFGGRTAGIVANQPLARAGVLDADASRQAARFVQFCDAFNIPLVTLVDVPGFLSGVPGLGQEHHGIMRHGARLLYAYCDATVPRVQVTLRRAYGSACIVTDSLSAGADMSFAWPLAAGRADQLVDDVIDPADTRAVISRALDLLIGKRPERAPRKHGNPPA